MYLKLQFGLIFLLLFALAGFNFVVDPYGIYLSERALGFHDKKTQFFMKEPVIKPFRVADVGPRVVILGISDAGLGYDETHTCFDAGPFYNFSMAGASMYMLYRAFQHALAEADLERVVLDLNFISFNEHHAAVTPSRAGGNAGTGVFESLLAVNQDGSRNWLGPFRQIAQAPRFLLSSAVTQDSLETLELQGPYDGWNLNQSGGWRGATLRPEQSQRQRFMAITKYMFGDFFSEMSATGEFSIYRQDGGLSRAFEYYERLLSDAYARGIEVVLVLSPTHAYYYEAIEYHGMNAMFADWKSQLVKINDRVAAGHGKKPFPIWDFAAYSELTTEVVPDPKARTARMQYYFDPLHFKPALGDKVLDQACLGKPGAGTALTVDNLAHEFARQAQFKQQFRSENEDSVRRLRAVFKQVSGKNPQ